MTRVVTCLATIGMSLLAVLGGYLAGYELVTGWLQGRLQRPVN